MRCQNPVEQVCQVLIKDHATSLLRFEPEGVEVASEMKEAAYQKSSLLRPQPNWVRFRLMKQGLRQL